MVAKAPKPSSSPAVEADELRRSEVDAFILDNREELNASIRRSREEVAKGVRATRTIADIIASGRKRHGGG